MHKLKAIALIILGVVKFDTISRVGLIPTKRRGGQMNHVQSKNNTNEGFDNLKIKREDRVSLIKRNQDSFEEGTERNQNVSTNNFN